MNAKNILLMNDMPGYGKVALAAMVPLLSRMGHYTFQLPTAIVSNTLDYGKFRIQEMTEYMRDTLRVWDELGFDPDCVCTGFVVSNEQVDLIREYLESRDNKKERLVLVDPIMADGGKLYNGIGQERVAAMCRLAALSDVMVPNITEAVYMVHQQFAGEKCALRPGDEAGTTQELRQLTDALHQISGKSVVITSAWNRENEEHLVCGYDHKKEEYFEVPYEYLPVRVAGSGDIFSTMMLGELLAGKTLKEAVQKAVRTLTRLIKENQGHMKDYKGILVERYWEILDEA